MYAIKKHINKVLAAFLCACLLLSYNPAFGTATTAWADETTSGSETFGAPYAPTGSHTEVGELTDREVTIDGSSGTGSTGDTVVKAGTFTSDLLVNMTEGPLFATTGQIKDSTNPFELIVQATCSEADNLDDYEFKWTATANGTDLPKEVIDLINSGAYNTPAYDDKNNVASISLDMKKLIQNNPGLFQDDVKYDFTCEVTMKATDPVKKEKRNVTLLTVSQDLSDSHSKTRLEDKSEPTPVVATGHFLSTAELKTDLASDNETVIGPFATEAQRGSTDYEKFGLIRDKDGNASQVYQVGIEGSLEVSDTITLGATKGSYDLWFPIDEQYVYDPVKNTVGYQEHDLIPVLWKNRYTNTKEDLQRLTAEIVRDAAAPEGTGQLMAKITYNPTEVTGGKATIVAKDAAGKDTTYTAADGEETNVPGFFALVYSSNKMPPKDGEKSYYSVSATVNDENKGTLYGLADLSTLKMDGEPVYVETGTSVRFNVLPQVGNDGKRYQLTSLLFKSSATAEAKEVLNGSTKDMGITIDAANSCVVIGEPACKQFYAEYSFEAKFEQVPDDMATSNYSDELILRVVNEDDMSTSNHGIISTTYTKLGETDPQRTEGNDYTVLVHHGGYADLNFMVNAGLNDTNYEIKRVETSATGADGTWAPAAWMPGCQLSLPHITSSRMYVRMVVGTANTSVSQPLYYNVVVKAVGGDSHCNVTPETGIIAVNNSAYSELSFAMTGYPDKQNGGFYAQSYTITEGNNDTNPQFVDLENDEAKNTGTFTKTYKPSDAVLKGLIKGDIVIEVTFHTTNPTPRQLTLKVVGEGGKAALAGGGLVGKDGKPSLLDSNGVATVGSGESFTILTVPDNGYMLNAIRVEGETIGKSWPTTDDPSILKTGVYVGKMPDEDITVTVVFTDVLKADLSGKRTLNVYVADKDLTKTGSDTEYIWKSTVPIEDSMGAAISDSTVINAPEDGVYRGMVNGKDELVGLTFPMGDSYVMNFKGKAIGSKQYEVSKVLVVPYHVDPNDSQKKIADGRTLYNWNAATFALNYKTWTTYPNVDVIVYFDEVTKVDADGNPDPNQPDEYAKLIIPDEGGVLKDTLQPPAGTTVEVLPGGYVTITDMRLEDGKEWDDENPVLINGEPISDDDFKKLVETGVLEVGPMPAGGTTIVEVNAHKKEVITIPETFPVYADNPTEANGGLLGKVYVTVDGESKETNSVLPVNVPTSDVFDISFEDVSERGFQVTDVAFMVDPYKANDPAMKAWVLKNVSKDGEFYNSLVFSATQPTKDHVQYKYTNDRSTTPSISIGSSDATLWRVEGLVGEMTVLPTFDEIPDKIDPNNEAWKVQAGITNGKGSLTMSYDNKAYGNQVNVLKTSTKPVYVNIQPAAGYKLKDVTVKTSSDNPLINLWNMLTGGNVSNMTQTVNANGGQLTIAPVKFDYEILVEFENTDTSMLDTTTIPINVYSDTNKGTVKPNTNVRANRDGKQTFTVDVKSLIDEGVEKWYSVKSVKVTPHYVDADGKVGTADTVTADATTDKSPVEWGSNEVMFTVDIAEANASVPSNATLSAVDVEVVYGPANHETKPEPDYAYTAKQVTIGSSTGGGVVSPYGTYEIYPYQVDDSDNGWAKFLVVVSPQEGYSLSDLKVTRTGASTSENEALAASYLNQINGESTSSTGCFYIDAVPGSDSINNEVIDIQFARLSASDRTYTITMIVDPKGTGSGTVVTKMPVTLPLTESFSYSINVPAGSNTGIRVKDQYKVGDKYYDVPESAATQAGTTPIERSHNNNCLLVNPAAILNQVVDRYITITFETLPADGLTDADKVTPIDKNDKVSIKVNVHSNTTTDIADALQLTPYASLNNVLLSDKSHYLYNWWFDTTGTQKNYYVYCVKVNNQVLDGYADTPQNGKLKKEGSYLFDKDTLQSGTNYLDIYVGSFLNGVVSSTGNGGDIEVDWGTGGWVQNLNGTLAGTGPSGFGSVASYFASLSGTTEMDVNGVMTFGAPGDEDGDDEDGDGDDGDVGTNKQPANMVKVYNIIPQPGYVIDHVYLYNCHPYPTDDPETTDVNEAEESWQWTTPSVSLDPKWASLFGESWDKYIVLQYALELDTPNTVGYMYASFEYKGTGNIDDMNTWDPTDDKNHDILGNDNLFIHYYPHDYAKEIAPIIHSGDTLVEYLHEGSQGQNGTVAVRGRTEDMGDRYIATYSTLENIAPGDMFTFRVGPLLPEDGSPNAADKLYTIDVEELNKKMPNVTVTPEVPAKAVTQSLSYGADDDELLIDENAGIETQADDANVNKYYKYYTVRGTAAALGLNNGKVTLQLPLDKLTVNSGEFPELPSLDKGTTTNPTTYTLEASAGTGGTITPTSTAAVASWNNGNTTGPWTVARGTRVAFNVQADDDYRLTGLTRNGTIDCLSNGNYTGDGVSGTLLFPVYSDTEVVAEFTPKNDSSASRTVTIAVQGGHGTTSPTPGTYQVEKGQPYSITFQPESGYVPYRIWVDGVESFAGPTWVGYTLPASWSNQTFTVQYAVAGTTPTTGQQLVQTGQNVLNDAATGLVRTGDNPVAIACIVGVAVLAAFGVWQMRRRKAAAARAAKYSVTKRRIK